MDNLFLGIGLFISAAFTFTAIGVDWLVLSGQWSLQDIRNKFLGGDSS